MSQNRISLEKYRILVAEDEFMLAEEFCMELEDAGAVVVGPAASLDQLMRLIAVSPKLHGAILDVNLRGEMTFQAADQLVQAGVPFIFATGYDVASIPERFGHVVCCEKPFIISNVARTIHQAMGA